MGATGVVLAEANAVPCWWEGTDQLLGPGIDATMTDAFARPDAGEPANALCALAGKVAPAARGRELAAEVLHQMRRLAVAHGLSAVIAPVRPSWKARYPLFPIVEYATWRRAAGRPVDACARASRSTHGTRAAAVAADHRALERSE
jgi:hypothetical protein